MKKVNQERQDYVLVYPATIVPEGTGFVVNFRDLENVFTEAESYQDALLKAQEVLDILLLDMAQDDLPIPDSSPCQSGEVNITVSPEVAVPVLLHRLRMARDLSMADVAKTMGVTYQSYQQIEAGKNITLRSLKRAAAAMGAIVEIRLHTSV